MASSANWNRRQSEVFRWNEALPWENFSNPDHLLNASISLQQYIKIKFGKLFYLFYIQKFNFELWFKCFYTFFFLKIAIFYIAKPSYLSVSGMFCEYFDTCVFCLHYDLLDFIDSIVCCRPTRQNNSIWHLIAICGRSFCQKIST